MRPRLLPVARLLALLCSFTLASTVQAQLIVPEKGADLRVDYQKMKQIGPWDDRNYKLTKEDLAFLAPNEDQLRAQIPVFFRVELRKGIPEMSRSGPVQYPRSALQIFKLKYGGYLVGGKIYQGAERKQGAYKILMEADGKPGIREDEFWANKFLNGEVRITSPNGAAESAIKINPVDSNTVIAGSNGPGTGQQMHYSTDGGETWNSAAALPLGGTCCDPTVDWSSDGTLAYTATLGNCGGSGCQIWFYRSSDGGQTWNDLSGSRRTLSSGNANDKEFIHVDKWPSSPHLDNIYATWHSSNVMQFAVSTDSGDTWSSQAFSSATNDRGIGSDITTDKSGTVYYLWPAFNAQTIKLRRSTNGGNSFGATTDIASTQGSFAFPVPSMETREVFMYVSADTDFSNGPYGDSIYAAWTDSTSSTSTNPNNNHARIRVAYSRDGGNSWNVTTPHETADANSVDRWHQWLTVDEDGTVHVVFYDTRRDPSRSSVDLFYTYSTDGAQTWVAPTRVTDQQSPNIGDSFEFGDYNGLDVVMQDLIAIYTDNRNEGGGGADSVDVYAAGIPVTGGCSPQAVADAGADRTINEGNSTTLGTGALAGHTYSWSPGGASSAQISVSPSTTTTYTVTATTSCGSRNDSVTVTVIPAGSNGPQTAVYNSGLGAPVCTIAGSSCDSTTLLDGRASLGPEPNQPNTLDGCSDGASGSYHNDESNDRLVVSTLDESNFSQGTTVRVDATVWAWSTGSSDTLDLYYAADANNPSWTYITSLNPSGGGVQNLSAQYTLPTGSLQAVRAVFRYQGSQSSCSGGNYDDADDLVFAVEGGAINQDPTVTINAPANGSNHTQGTSVSFSASATDPEDGTISSSISWTSNLDGSIGSGASFSTSNLSAGSHTITASVTDSGGASDSDQISISVNNSAPSVTIGSPTNGASFDQGSSVSFSGSASDVQDGNLGSSISWTSSSDGAIGSGASFSTSSLSLGAHTITASVTDSGGLSDTDQISITIESVSSGCTDCVDWNVTGTVSYSNQDAAANVTVESADTILLEDNTWRRTTQTYNVTANTVIEFEFQSTSQGEIHGIGFDEDDGLSSNRIFKVHGTQNWGITDFDNYSGSGFTTYTIPVGQYFTGSAMYLVLVNDYDAGSGNNSRFQNVRIYEDTGGGGNCQTIDFGSETLTAYSNQDNSGTVNAEDGGATLFMEGNRWRRTTRTFAVGSATELCFDFSSSSQGEIHGIGFDEDDGLSSNRIFKVHGTQNWGIGDFDNYSGSSFTNYCIPVGSYYTNSSMYLVFVNDKDSGSLNNTSRFRNVQVCD